MLIFIDIDDTVLQTTRTVKGKTLVDLLVAELNAPLFEGAEETVKQFKANGNTCYFITARGSLADEEISVTKQRFHNEKIAEYTNGFLSPVVNKYKGIETACKEFLKVNFNRNDIILIDNDLAQVANCANNGIFSILFAPDFEKDCKENGELIDMLAQINASVAKSWDEIGKIVSNKTHSAGEITR